MSASLETKFLKLPTQSQMLDVAKDLAGKLNQLGLTKDDVVYLDLISNLVYLGTEQDGNSIEPFKDEGKRWHISGSLVAAAKPRIRWLLDKMAAIRESYGETRILCAVPIPRYVAGRCCDEQLHLDNVEDDDIGEIHDAVRANSRSSLLTAFPGNSIFDPLSAFTAEYNSQELLSLNSSGGVTIWREDDPVHLTDTAYVDITDHLVNVVKGNGGGDLEEARRGEGWRALSPDRGLTRCRSRYRNGCWAATKAAPEGAPPVTAVEEEERLAGEAGPAAVGPHIRGSINMRIWKRIQWHNHNNVLLIILSLCKQLFTL